MLSVRAGNKLNSYFIFWDTSVFLQTSKLLLQYQNDDTNILLKICADVVWLFTESVQSVVCIVCCSQQHCTGSVAQSSVWTDLCIITWT